MKKVLIIKIIFSLLTSTLQAQEIEHDGLYNLYQRLNSGLLLPDDVQALDYLKRFANDTLIIRKIFDDKNGNNSLEIKLINPCRKDRYDHVINYIKIRLNNKNFSNTLIYYNSGVQMSLINLLEENIALKYASRQRQAVIILFAYCGNADDDKIITCIVLYNENNYIYHIRLRGVEFQNYRIIDDLSETFKDLPKKLNKKLVKYFNSQYETIIQ